jgi:hypothetical protein
VNKYRNHPGRAPTLPRNLRSDARIQDQFLVPGKREE